MSDTTNTDTIDNKNLPATQVAPDQQGGSMPVRSINKDVMQQLGARYSRMFNRYAQERYPAEVRWLKSVRQYLGVYDPDIERQLATNRSRAYPRLTRVKCVSMLSRIMNLMFPGNERNWELTASPSAEMAPADVEAAVMKLVQQRQADGTLQDADETIINEAVQALADERAEALSVLIDDQLQELGGDQTADFIRLNRQVCDSGIKYGLGLLRGPFVRAIQTSGWVQAGQGQFAPVTRTTYKPQYEFLPVWDFYPDMSAKSIEATDGYFTRLVMSRSAFRKLADRPDFIAEQVKDCIRMVPGGNYRPRSFENELKVMGVSMEATTTTPRDDGREKYEIIVWNGPVTANALRDCGAQVPDGLMAEDIEAELWIVDNRIIKAQMNPWRSMGVDVRTVHAFIFDEDDTSPIGCGLPVIMRDTQLSVCAATRMAIDNASVTCGPNLEVNTALMVAGQDLTQITPHKLWYRDDDGPTQQFPAVRRIEIDGHITELQGLIKTFMDFAEIETFIGPGTGGDMSHMPSEPMRTAAGASMLRGDAALPFKDIVRNYDSFTQSVIVSLVQFNRKFNPTLAPAGDFNVVARGATSLIAKEVRGAQIDQLSQTLTPEDWDHVDRRKFIEQRMASRDLQSMLVSPGEAAASAAKREQAMAAQQQQQSELIGAQVREALANAFKNITQGQKNASMADATSANAALAILDSALNPESAANDTSGQPKPSSGTGKAPAAQSAG